MNSKKSKSSPIDQAFKDVDLIDRLELSEGPTKFSLEDHPVCEASKSLVWGDLTGKSYRPYLEILKQKPMRPI